MNYSREDMDEITLKSIRARVLKYGDQAYLDLAASLRIIDRLTADLARLTYESARVKSEMHSAEGYLYEGPLMISDENTDPN